VPETVHLTCIGCPVGCPLQLEHEGSEIKEISGNECDRGAKYARQEFLDPRRDLSTTVAVSNALWPRLPVRLTGPIPKDKVLDAVRRIHRIRVEAPVTIGQILEADFMGEKGVHLVASRSMPAAGQEDVHHLGETVSPLS